MQAWLGAMRAAGVSLTIVSNNTARRVRPFAGRIGLDFVPLACKPLPLGLMAARRRLGVTRREMAMVGDRSTPTAWPPGLYGIRCLYVLPRTPHEHNRGGAPQAQAGTLLGRPLFPKRGQSV